MADQSRVQAKAVSTTEWRISTVCYVVIMIVFEALRAIFALKLTAETQRPLISNLLSN